MHETINSYVPFACTWHVWSERVHVQTQLKDAVVNFPAAGADSHRRLRLRQRA